VETMDEFRSRVRGWLAGNYLPRDPNRDDDRVDIIARAPDGHQALVDGGISMQRQVAAAGFMGLKHPTEYGGGGLTAAHDQIVAEEMQAFECPSIRPLSLGMGLALPTLLKHGTEEQRQRFAPKIIAGEEVWCQLFSEPDAGSDLVSLRTRATRDGDVWVVSGQKVWSSMAAEAQFGIMLARTDPTAATPHSGITMFILPMDRVGVTVRSLVDIAGGHHFNEVFLDSVEMTDDEILGELNKGWQVATGTLSGERGAYVGGSGGGRRKRQVMAALASTPGGAGPVERQRAVDVVARELLLDWLVARVLAGTVAGGNPVAGSLIKLAAGNLEQLASEVVIDLLGPAGVAWASDDRDGDIASHILNAARQATIAGGTHQIQRNLLGERVLGLPREPK
jgi:alkylation response protein AidB-like acyl-CoA dehydrogenase